MKFPKRIAAAIGLLILWLVLSWLLGTWLHLASPGLWILRIGLMTLGIAGFVGYAILSRQPASSTGAPVAADAASDIDFAFTEAANRLRAANLLKGSTVAALPAIFVLGDANAAKTSILAHSGLEPELVAGQAYLDNVVAPTRAVNVWFARQTIFIDPSGKMVADEGARRKLFRKFAPAAFGSVFGGATSPPRAVVVALSCETLLQAGGAEAAALKARQMQAVLGELAQELGAGFPVYVLFTKSDRIPYFREFAENLMESEAAEPFGATLPLQPAQSGVYAEEQTRRLNEAFQRLYYSLADKRTAFLIRENDSAKLPNVYEFPREFGKLRSLLVPFLVDLCRPSQLRTNPFLRGFFFTGVRPIVVSDLAPAPQAQPEPAAFDAGATRIFGRQAAMPLMDMPQGSSRKAPQWVFLSHLFSGLILADKPALGVAQSSVKVSFWRRAALAAAAAVAVVLAILWAISFTGNHELVSGSVGAAQRMPAQGLPSTQLASLDSLQQLEQMREKLALLDEYGRAGKPLHLRFGLYSGDAIRDPLRQVYYGLFRRVLLAPTQDTWIAACSNPPKSNDIANYGAVYDALKAYLITTQNHEKSSRDFLSPVLMRYWLNGRQIDDQRRGLAQNQFDFYANDLAGLNPYPHFAHPNENAVSSARVYLNAFGYQQRVYQGMLTEASKQNPSIVFNQEFPGSAAVVVNNYRVDGAFTKTGFAAFQKELQDPDKYSRGEEWVLGPASNIPPNKAELVQELQKLYQGGFVNAWRSYIKATTVVPYHGVQDAANKLGRLTGNGSPLLLVLCVASQNTAVPDKNIASLFQPPQIVTPPQGCLEKPSSTANAPYMDALTRLQSSLSQVAANPGNDAAKMQTIADASQATGVARDLDRNFPRDGQNVDENTFRILLAPIASIPGLVGGLDRNAVNGQAKALCAQMRSLLAKYPFNPKSPSDATLTEVSSIFKQPDGALWATYNQNFQKLMVRQGSQFVAVSGQNMTVTGAFLNWFSRAAVVSDALFKNGAQSPSFTFAIKPAPSDDIEGVSLEIDGQSAKYPKGGGSFQQFTWPGNVQNAALQVRFVKGTSFNFPTGQPGLWSLFRWLDSTEHWQQQGTTYTFESTVRTNAGPVTIPSNGHPATVKFILDPMGSPVRPGFFSGLSACPSVAVQ
jgi:type VI secretion system protein ImpL